MIERDERNERNERHPSHPPRGGAEAGVRASMVLCAGLGTRLRPLSDETAKPMVPIGDRAALAHVVARVRLAVSSPIVVNVHHRPDDVRAWAKGEGIAVSHEPVLLGTAGGLAAAAALLGQGDVLVWNGDILSDLDPRELIAAHHAVTASAASAHTPGATLAIRARAPGEGNVGLDHCGRIVRLRAERFGATSLETRGGEFLGIHVISGRLRASLPPVGCLVGDVYLPALRRGETLHAHMTGASFTDIGSLSQYLAANAAWLAREGLASWSHPSAVIRAPINGSVIGAGAIVDAPALGSVVWAGAHVQAACEHAVVTPRSVARPR